MSQSVTTISAVKLSAKQVESLEKGLEKKFGKISIHQVVDSTIIGGLKIRIGSQEFDGSLQGKVRQVREQLLAQI